MMCRLELRVVVPDEEVDEHPPVELCGSSRPAAVPASTGEPEGQRLHAGDLPALRSWPIPSSDGNPRTRGVGDPGPWQQAHQWALEELGVALPHVLHREQQCGKQNTALRAGALGLSLGLWKGCRSVELEGPATQSPLAAAALLSSSGLEASCSKEPQAQGRHLSCLTYVLFHLSMATGQPPTTSRIFSRGCESRFSISPEGEKMVTHPMPRVCVCV